MFKCIFLALFVAASASAFEEDLQVFSEGLQPLEDVFVPAEELPPRTLVRFRRQLFGGVSTLPSGGFNSNLGYRGSVFSSPTRDLSAWGQFSGSAVPSSRGLNYSPATFRGGADFKTSAGHGLSSGLSHTAGLGGTGTLGGNLNLLSTPNHKVDVFGSASRNFDNNFKFNGPTSTTLGTKWQHQTGAEAAFSGTRTPGLPNSYSYSASTPILNGNAGVGLSGRTVERVGSEVTLTGKAHITPNLVGSVSHTRAFDTKLNPLGSSTSLGADYNHHSGLQLSASGTRTSGQPNSATLGASVPLYQSKDGNTKVMLGGQSQFTQGQKPNHEVALTVGTTF